jgi:hypothetical protein
MKQIDFKKEKLATYGNVSQFFMEQKILLHKTGEDYLQDTLTAQLESFCLARINTKQWVKVKSKRPSFLDWLLRKERSFDVEVECKEVMRHPKSMPDSEIFFTATPLPEGFRIGPSGITVPE